VPVTVNFDLCKVNAVDVAVFIRDKHVGLCPVVLAINEFGERGSEEKQWTLDLGFMAHPWGLQEVNLASR